MNVGVNIGVLVFALLFAIYKSVYFGWHIFAESDAEIICDGMVLLIAALSFINVSPQKE